MTGLTARWGDSAITVAAMDWADAAAPVMIMGDGGWLHTGRQVADFRHSSMRALHWAVERAAGHDGAGEMTRPCGAAW